MKGIKFIKAERKRQIKKEKFDAKKDATYKDNQLVRAAVCYALPDYYRYLSVKTSKVQNNLLNEFWPWDEKWWKPTPENRIKELSKAGALIAAEIDRIINEIRST